MIWVLFFFWLKILFVSFVCLFIQTKPKDLQVVTTDRSKPTEPLPSSRGDTCPARISNSARYGKPKMKPSREKGGSRVEKFDPVIGISVIVLTLVIMLVWGRLCAILCTSAWCYFLPRLRDAAALAKRKRSGSDGSVCAPDLNSESYKRKVVMDGFLGRQNRVSLSWRFLLYYNWFCQILLFFCFFLKMDKQCLRLITMIDRLWNGYIKWIVYYLWFFWKSILSKPTIWSSQKFQCIYSNNNNVWSHLLNYKKYLVRK